MRVLCALLGALGVMGVGGRTRIAQADEPAAAPAAEAWVDPWAEPAPAPVTEPAVEPATTTPLFAMPLTGRLFGDAYVPFRWPWNGSFQQLSTSVWMEVDPRWGDSVGGRIVGSGDVIFESTVGAERYRPKLREAYLYWRRPGLELRVGEQIIPWGPSDAVNPTDFLTAKDFTFFNPDEEVRREGAPSASIAWTPQSGNAPLTLTAVLVALPARSTLLLPSAFIPPSAAFESSPAAQNLSLNSSAAALKTTYAGSGWDASLVGYEGWNNLPELSYAGYDATRGQVLIRPAFHRIWAVGGDGSATFGSWVARAEGAYVLTENNDGTNPLIQPTHLSLVGGLERPLGNDFRVGLQGIWRFNPRLSPPQAAPYTDPYSQLVNPLLASANAVLFGYQERSQPSATLRISYSNEVRGIEADAFGFFNFVGRDSFVRVKVSYLIAQSLKVTVGLDHYAGPTDSPFGALKEFSALFLETKYVF